MPYDMQVYELARSFGADSGLADQEIARLAQHIQDEIESEIDYLLIVRKEPTVHG
jgi:hypothetical protein